jgi:hypothetical protein
MTVLQVKEFIVWILISSSYRENIPSVTKRLPGSTLGPPPLCVAVCSDLIKASGSTGSTVGTVHVLLIAVTGDPVDCYPPIQLLICSMAVDPPLTSWPKHQVSTLHCFFATLHCFFATLHCFFATLHCFFAIRHCFFAIRNFIFHFLYCYSISLGKKNLPLR